MISIVVIAHVASGALRLYSLVEAKLSAQAVRSLTAELAHPFVLSEVSGGFRRRAWVLVNEGYGAQEAGLTTPV